ncbi:MAG: aspartate carbamoyltransferase [Spirochaetales bacterium]|nr:aspartate carbamoyltransferase [Spirochaetales bacterium]
MSSPFKGRSISVVNDLTIDEQVYLYEKTAQLKSDILNNRDLTKYRINNNDSSIYLIFLEDSTRTKESFRNAAAFHKCRVNMFDHNSSSFNKSESITDTVRMLTGYSKDSTFIIRSKEEGLCRWLDFSMAEYASSMGLQKPVFINGGDGKHEHPTQEFLDEFSFLEQKNWDRSNIHIALIGDLFHGRTVHSKVDGLKIFKNVKVDLIAPAELALPDYYIERMKANNYEIRIFETLDEYIASNDVADIWYFTRLQLERMGDDVLKKAPSLRYSVTFRKDLLPKVSKDVRFYHPLPRHMEFPVIPPFLDNTYLNAWDRQSINGYYTRIMEIALTNGVLGEDFTGSTFKQATYHDDFIIDAEISNGSIKSCENYKVGIKPVENGIVIDHIARGDDIEKIWNHVDKIRRILKLNYRSSHGVYHCNDRSMFKGIISIPDVTDLNEKTVKMLAAVSPGSTLNMVKDGRVIRKLRLNMPPRVYGFDDIGCLNENCISHISKKEPIKPEFYRTSNDKLVCKYCENYYNYNQIWRR